MTDHSIEDLREDFQNLTKLTQKSPLYVEIRTATEKIHRKMRERLAHDLIDFEDAFQRTTLYLTSPMSASSDVSPLQHYLEIEFVRRQVLGEPLLITEFRRILYSIIRNELRKVHTDSYVEALVDRSVRHLSEFPNIIADHKTKRFRTDNAASEIQPPTPYEIIAIANKCSSVPKIPQSSATRNSSVYSPQNLQFILEVFISSVHHFHKDDLFELFSYLLTSWTPNLLSISDDATSREYETVSSAASADAEVGSTEFAHQHADRIWSELTENQRRFMHANTWNVQQEEIARRVQFVDQRNPSLNRNYARPTIVNLQKATLERLKNSLVSFDRDEQIEIIRILNETAANYQF